jgi:hypothetical protein
MKTCPVKTNGKRCNRYLKWRLHALIFVGLLLKNQGEVGYCPTHGPIETRAADEENK